MDNKAYKNTEVAVEEETKIPNKEIETKLPSEPSSKKNMKEEKARKKDDKSVEQVLKALNSLETTEEKLAAMCKKYADIVDENRKFQLSVKQSEKRMIVLQREKEQLQTEHSKAVLTRSRLESLCRELQRQNKAVKDESLLKIREEEEKRKEVSAKFQSTLTDVTTLMQQNNEKNSKLREDNLEMTKKFKSVCEQYEIREQQVEKISKQMQLETQLADAKLAKAKMEMAAEKEMLLREKQELLLEVTEYQAKIQELQTTEVNLRSQISLYTNKYDEFQNALSRSNDVFEGFKGEMEKMSKKIYKLEKETSSWKQRWEKSHQALLEMAADKQQRDGELALATRQLAQLQKLCRTLQAERTSLLAQIKGAGKGTVATAPLSGESIQQDNRLQITEGDMLKDSNKQNELPEEGQGELPMKTLEAEDLKMEPGLEPAIPSEQSPELEINSTLSTTTIHNMSPDDIVTEINGTVEVLNEALDSTKQEQTTVSIPAATQLQTCVVGVAVKPSSDLVIQIPDVENASTLPVDKSNQEQVSAINTVPQSIPVATFMPQMPSMELPPSDKSPENLPTTPVIGAEAGAAMKNESTILSEPLHSFPNPASVAAAVDMPDNKSTTPPSVESIGGFVGGAELKTTSNEETPVIKAVPSPAGSEPAKDAVLPAGLKPVALETKKSKDGAKKRKK